MRKITPDSPSFINDTIYNIDCCVSKSGRSSTVTLDGLKNARQYIDHLSCELPDYSLEDFEESVKRPPELRPCDMYSLQDRLKKQLTDVYYLCGYRQKISKLSHVARFQQESSITPSGFARLWQFIKGSDHDHDWTDKDVDLKSKFMDIVEDFFAKAVDSAYSTALRNFTSANYVDAVKILAMRDEILVFAKQHQIQVDKRVDDDTLSKELAIKLARAAANGFSCQGLTPLLNDTNEIENLRLFEDVDATLKRAPW